MLKLTPVFKSVGPVLILSRKKKHLNIIRQKQNKVFKQVYPLIIENIPVNRKDV